MCRHLAYLGPDTGVAQVLQDGEHSLLVQSYAPRDMRKGGTVNADGWGAAWWRSGRAEHYRSHRPMWTDEPGLRALGAVRGQAVMGAVRSATVGMPVVHTACAPFVDGRWAFSHNGVVAGWPDSLAPFVAEVPLTDLLRLPAPTDSAALWTVLRQRLDAGTDPGAALATLCAGVGAAEPGSRLNLLLSDGTTIWATSWYHSLSVRDTGDSVVVSSEPSDDNPGWVAVPDHHLVTARPGDVIVTPLEGP